MFVKGQVNYTNDIKDKQSGRQAGRLDKQTGKMAIKWAFSVIT